MAEAILLTSSDLAPLRDDPTAMDGALAAVETAVVAHYRGKVRQGRLVDRRPGEFEGIRLSLLAGEGLPSGMRIFGNPPHTRAFMLFDGETRAITALMDYGILNSMRVGATAGVAGRHLAPRGARLMALLGSGWQAMPQAAAMRSALPALERIRVFSPTAAHRESFAREANARLGIAVEPVASAREAIDGADIVDCCAPGHFDVREPLFETSWIKPGALVISMAPNQYAPDLILKSRVVTASWEDLVEPAPRPPFAELIAEGKFTREHVIRLGAVIADGATVRRNPDDIVLYHLEGGTGQDLFVAGWGYQWAKARGLGRPFDLSR